MSRTAVSLITALMLALVAISVSGAATKPKPWQWAPTKVVTRLKASSPIVGGDVGSDVLDARCLGKGKSVAGRFSRFICETRWGSSNGSYTSTLTIRILALGSGKLCVVTTPDYRAIPWTIGTQGTRIKPERACP